MPLTPEMIKKEDESPGVDKPSAPYAVAVAPDTPQTATPSTVPAVLRAAADLIEPEGRWTQEVQARDASGEECGVLDDDAVCWCIYGALWHFGIPVYGPEADAVETPLIQVIGADQGIDQWNDVDGRTQAEVVAALRKAADLAEAGEATPNDTGVA
jgi:hypothetical protein